MTARRITPFFSMRSGSSCGWTSAPSAGRSNSPRPRDKQGFLSHWQGLYEAAPPPTPDAIQKDTAESLLRKLMELNDPAYLAASYILAVMLERKRILRVKEQIRSEGRRTFIYEQPKTGDIFTIPDPDLQLDQLEAVQRQVGSLLEHGLNPPPGAETQAPAAAVPEDSIAPTAPTEEPAEAAAVVVET